MPPWRTLSVLIAAVLAVGILTGAALGPSPERSLADNSTVLQRVIALLAARGDEDSRANAQPPSDAPAGATASAIGTVANGKDVASAKTGAPAPAKASDPSSRESSSSPESPVGAVRPSSGEEEHGSIQTPARLPAIQHVWLVMLNGSTILNAETAPTGYPYLVGQLVKQGVLLRNYSALDSYELAGDAALLPGGVGASLSVISQPGCEAPNPPPSAPCTEGAQTSPAEADQFLQRVVTPILTSPAYREDGLILIASAAASSSAGVPATTLAPQPAAGALLLSPLLHPGAQTSSPFDSLSPRRSLATIFRH
jgi:hypothetical protein